MVYAHWIPNWLTLVNNPLGPEAVKKRICIRANVSYDQQDSISFMSDNEVQNSAAMWLSVGCVSGENSYLDQYLLPGL